MIKRVFFLGLVVIIISGCNDRSAPAYSTQSVGEVQNQIRLLEGRSAGLAIATDNFESYFEELSTVDVHLQMGIPDSMIIDKNEYTQWLSELPQPWPADLAERAQRLLKHALRECEAIFPNLAPDTIDLILTDDLPYGASVYFTRGQSVVCPRSHLKNASDGDLMHVFRHELFHLISRENAAGRSQMYELIGFKPVVDSLIWPGNLYERRLLNPDAPKPDYFLDLDGAQYVPIVYASQAPYDAGDPDYFAQQLRFQYFQLVNSKLRPPTLSVAEVREATGDLTNYIIHPEEILADQFALLLEQGSTNSDAALSALYEYLLGLNRASIN
ncbi:MAG: hypothetical protein AAFY91_03640 [Bacteroidota bacterium]